MSTTASKLFSFIALVVIIVFAVVLLLYLWPRRATVEVDYANRTSTVVIPPGFYGVGGVGSTVSNTEAIKKITSINLLGNRIWAALDLIYESGTTPWYGTLDQQIQRATSDGLDPIIVLSGTPPHLGASSCAVPTNVNAWGDDAAAIAGHIEQTHPGLKYEVWNEPDSSVTLCTNNQLKDYLGIYAAAAPKIKAAAPTSKVGGPALASPGPNTATWIPAFLGDSRTAPYVDFVSWHLYPTGQWDLDKGMDWSYLYNITQSPTQGLSYYYRTLESYVRKGSQPNAATTPIYLTEYNASHVFAVNCCSNNPVYGPLWNVLAFVDFMNTVRDGATRPPDKLNYFMSSASGGYFCILGTLNDAMDCKYPASGTVFQNYPQFAAFQLFTGADYLNLENTGANVVATPKAPSDVVALGLYSPTADSLVLVNPTGKGYAMVSTKMLHVGIQNMTGWRYSLANGMLIKDPLRVITTGNNNVSMATPLPPYSTVVLSLVQAN